MDVIFVENLIQKEEGDGTSKGNSETTIVQEENSEKEDSDSSEAASAHEAQVPDESEAMIFGGRLERGKNRYGTRSMLQRAMLHTVF